MGIFSNDTTIAQSGLLRGFTDFHCHLLPGVDDGVKTLGATLETLSLYQELGITTAWLTPHIMEDVPNTTQDLRQRHEELRQAYDGPVELKLASENMLDSLFEERLDKEDLLPIGDDASMLLVETSYFNPPMDLDGMLERIRAKGYYPLLAHPERYTYMDRDDYRRLKRAGVRFQINLPSLVGGYGELARKKAEWLLKEGMADMCGTDTHSMGMIEATARRKALKKAVKQQLTQLLP